VIKTCYNNGQKERLCLIIENAGVRNSVSECKKSWRLLHVSGYGKRSINLNKVVATFEKHIFLGQTDLTRTGIISNSYNEMFEA
jgi:hypothetical protein